MVHYTNATGLPEAIVEAIRNDDYNKGTADITVSELISPPLQRWLRVRYADEITEDVADNIWALLGKAVHYILEKAESIMPVEQRLYLDVEHDQGTTRVGGAFDRVAIMERGNEIVLQDYKITSVWGHVFEGGKPKQDWVKQMNLYSLLLYNNGCTVDRLEVVCIFRDWSKLEAKRNPDYPQQQVLTLEVPKWPNLKTWNLLHECLDEHFSPIARPCTDEERWTKPTKYAVMKEGRKSAVRVFESREGADEFLELLVTNRHPKHYLEVRPGAHTRCESYCNVAEFCPQFKKEVIL